jgi:plasmid stabilization system protein ParE
VTEYRLVSDPRADLDIEATFHWYENEQPGLRRDFIDELRATYDRIVKGPYSSQRCLLRPLSAWPGWKRRFALPMRAGH